MLQFLPTSYAQLIPQGGLIPCEGKDCKVEHIITLVENIVFTLIALAGIAFVILLVVYGFQLVLYGHSPSKRAEAKDKIWKGVIGLVITLLAWTIVNAIFLVLGWKGGSGSMFQFGEIADPLDTELPIEDGTTTTDRDPRCPSCATPGGDLSRRGIQCKHTCTALPVLVNKIADLHTATAGDKPWRVTEGFPPTWKHKSACHDDGSCVDINFTGGRSASDIKTFVEKANSSGLCAIYEVTTQKQRTQLMKGGVPSKNIIVADITAPHFSVYNNTTKCNR